MNSKLAAQERLLLGTTTTSPCKAGTNHVVATPISRDTARRAMKWPVLRAAKKPQEGGLQRASPSPQFHDAGQIQALFAAVRDRSAKSRGVQSADAL